jgi:hypothetical protein
MHILLIHFVWCLWGVVLCGSGNGGSFALQNHRRPEGFSTTASAPNGVVPQMWGDESSDQQILQRMRHEAIVCVEAYSIIQQGSTLFLRDFGWRPILPRNSSA